MPKTARRHAASSAAEVIAPSSPVGSTHSPGDIESALAILAQAVASGSLIFRDGVPVVAQPPITAPRVEQPFDAVRRAMAQVREPKRQRKERHMQPRRCYSVAKVDTAIAINAIQTLTPAGAQMYMYLGDHPRSTVPEIVASLDLKKKTVENLLKIMRNRSLVVAEDRPRR